MNQRYSEISRTSKEGAHLQDYDSVADAARQMIKLHDVGNDKLSERARVIRVAGYISDCLGGFIPSAYGFDWKYK